jgi:hypothetical protein
VTSRGRRYLERRRAELADDDTFGRTEPETVDVWADQAPADWSDEIGSDRRLSIGAFQRLGEEHRE